MEEYNFLCGKCCFDFGMTVEKRKAMAARLKEGMNVCECCGKEMNVVRGVFRPYLTK